MTLSEYLARLIRATIILAVLGALGGAGIVLMWQYVANASETWDYFPRGMYIIPASVSIIWGGVTLGMAWFWINALFNTEYARVGPIDEATDRLEELRVEEDGRTRDDALMALMGFEGVDDEADASKIRDWLHERGVSDADVASNPKFWLVLYDDKDEALPSWNEILSRDEKSMTEDEVFDHMVDVQRARFADLGL